MKQARVLIVGAGFGGLSAAKALSRHRDLEITVIDRRNHHLFQPLLYQVATAGLSPAEIAVPIRAELSSYPNIRVILGDVSEIRTKENIVVADGEEFPYDFLILACGAQHSYFGRDEWEQYAPGLKTLEQATEIRRRILLGFEQAERETNPEKQKAYLTFLIVGGGPTGVELAGAIAEISRYTLEKDFRRIDPSRTRVILVEAGSRILAGFSPSLSKRASRDLERLGVQIWTSTRVTSVTENGAYLGAEFIHAGTIIWAAGVQPSPLGRALGTPLDRVGRVIVSEDLSLAAHPNVFVIGDMASFTGDDGQPLPGLAPVAMQQGRHAARQIQNTLESQPRTPFRYVDKGLMATIGKRKAILKFRSLEIGGWTAWMAWLFVHIYYLIGFKNKIFVFAQWTWNYLTFNRGARLIVDKDWRSKAVSPPATKTPETAQERVPKTPATR